MLDLNQVRVFIQVVRARSFAEAARRLSVPPNTLSRYVRQLEGALDTRLMQRSTRKLTLTAAGAAFYERCAPAVDDVLQAGKQVGGSQIPSGSIRVAAPADFFDFFNIDWVTEFLKANPRVKIDFVLSDARADLIGEAIDVAFRGGSAQALPSVYRQLSSQFFQLVASPAYLKKRGVPATLQALSAHDCLTPSGNSATATWVLTGPNGAEEVRVGGRLSANTARSLLKSCVAGLGIALLPGMLINADLQAKRLKPVLPEYRRAGADFSVVLPSHQQIPAAVLAFVELATTKLEWLNSVPGRSRRSA
jgi:DNA-binding transcriptional LysR family regulator